MPVGEQIMRLQVDQFGHAQSGPVRRHQQGLIAWPFRGVDDPPNLSSTQGLWQLPSATGGHFHIEVAAFQHVFEEESQALNLHVDGGIGQSLFRKEMMDPAANIFEFQPIGRSAVMLGQLPNCRDISRDGVW